MSFRLPDLGEGVAEAEIERWLVEPGQQIAEDEPMVEVMTDKATVEIPSPATGIVREIHVADRQVVPVGTVLVEIEVEGAASEQPAVQRGPGDVTPVQAAQRGAQVATGRAPAASAAGNGSTGTRVQATPLVRRIAAQLGVELAGLHGTGPGGRITEEDVRAAASAAHEPAADGGGQTRRIALTGIRRATAQHLAAAQQVPTVTVVEEADVTAAMAAERAAGRSIVPAFIRAVEAGIAAVPEANAVFDERANELVVHERRDVGVAMQTDAGLVVPVLRDVAALSLEEMDEQLAGLATRAREGALTPEELRGGTITVTSAGKLGGLFTTPLLNVPQVAIVGLHRAFERPVVRDGEIVVRTMANISISFDHRAFDGLAASTFVLAVVQALESSTG